MDAATIEISIVRMTAKDVPAVLAIQQATGLSAWSENSYLAALDSPEFYCRVARLDSETVGFLLARLITSEQLYEIFNIGVIPALQNRQIGRKLLNRFFAGIGVEIDRVLLEVRESNENAIGFYRRHGFVNTGKRINYYSNPAEHALVLEKRLYNHLADDSELG